MAIRSIRRYQEILRNASGLFVNRKSVLSSLLLLSIVLTTPLMSAYGELFTVTANRDIYNSGEKAVIVGVIPENAQEGYAVMLKVNGADGQQCSSQNILPDPDRSFVSKPVKLEDCGIGEYDVFAYYANMSATSTFDVSREAQSEAGNKLELRLLKNVVMQAQETANKKLKEFIGANLTLPEDIADKYTQGVFEASLVLQAIDFGNIAEAKKQLILSIRHLRQVIDELSTERLVFEQALELQTSVDDKGSSGIEERYENLREYYFRLEDLARKNGFDMRGEFDAAMSLLERSRQMADGGDVDGARRDLDRVSEMLEGLRSQLFKEEKGEDSSKSSDTNDQNDETNSEARRLTNVADKFEKRAQNLLGETNNKDVHLKIQEALALIAQARINIDAAAYESARAGLSAAFLALNDAEEMIDGDRDTGSGDSSEAGAESDGSGSEKDKDEEEDESDNSSSGSSSAGDEDEG